MEQTFNAKRISKRRLTECKDTLSQRDKDILRTVQLCKFVKTDQVGRLHFREAVTFSAVLRAATRGLTKLQKLGLVKALARRIGGVRAGSTSYVWTLAAAGAALLDLCEQNGESAKRSQGKARKRVFEPTYIFLKHTLAVAGIYVQLHEICSDSGNTNSDNSSIELQKTELEPNCWRSYIAPHGGTVCLKPDLYAVTASGGWENHWFFEADLDTEAPSRIIRKCEGYINYFHTGTQQEKSGVFPRVVWLVPDDKRMECLRRHIGENLREYTKLFAVITAQGLDELVKTGLAA
jgi:hypothetical protein